MSSALQRGFARLVTVSGPAIGPLELTPKPGGLLAGRQEQCDLRLSADTVSRAHARFLFDAARWRVMDLKSRWGTFVNGLRVASDIDVPLADGDLVRITPWTFRFSMASAPSSRHELETHDDSIDSGTLVHTITADRLPSLSESLLALLLESAAGIHAAQEESTLGNLLLEKVCLGTGMPNAALLRPVNDAGRYEVIASRGPAAGMSYSRSLLVAAAGGNVAELSGASSGNISESIVQLGLRSALCVPILIGQTVAAFLYVDARSETSRRLQPLRPNASAFCTALARMAGLALANLKRIEMERRSAQLEADLAAAAAAQQWILPQREGQAGPFRYTGQSRPGRYVGGDFYDVMPLGTQRLAIAIGDVSGKGIAASVLMTACQGFLHAALEDAGDPCEAVARVNRFIHARSQTDKFVTLWVGVLDLDEKTLKYVDAGHGYVMVGQSPDSLRRLDGAGQLPVGVESDTKYVAHTVELPESGCVLLLSDGIIEQPAHGDATDSLRFGMEGVERVLASLDEKTDAVAALFEAVMKHAGRATLADDATAVLVRW